MGSTENMLEIGNIISMIFVIHSYREQVKVICAHMLKGQSVIRKNICCSVYLS